MSERGGGARGGGRRGREGRIEDTRDRAVDTVNGRERSGDSEKKIADKIEYSEFLAVTRHFVTSNLVILRLITPFSHTVLNNSL